MVVTDASLFAILSDCRGSPLRTRNTVARPDHSGQSERRARRGRFPICQQRPFGAMSPSTAGAILGVKVGPFARLATADSRRRTVLTRMVFDKPNKVGIATGCDGLERNHPTQHWECAGSSRFHLRPLPFWPRSGICHKAQEDIYILALAIKQAGIRSGDPTWRWCRSCTEFRHGSETHIACGKFCEELGFAPKFAVHQCGLLIYTSLAFYGRFEACR